MHSAVAFLLLLAVGALAGCGNFFTKSTSGTGGTGGSGGSGGVVSGPARVYVGAVTSQTLSGFSVGTGTLTAVPSNALSIGFSPLAAVVTRNGKYLYVGLPGAINVHTIGTDGSLSAGQSVAIATTMVSLDVSPDGQWLFGLDAISQTLDEWKINSDGTLSTIGPVQYSTAPGQWVPKALRIAPSGGLIFAAVGTAGEVVFTLNTTSGLAALAQQRAVDVAQSSDNAIAVDSTSTHLYVARSGTGGGLMVFTVTVAGVITPVAGSPFATGAGATSVAIEGTGSYVYVANRSDATISGFAITANGVLTALAGSPFAAGLQVSSIGVDSSGKYLLAASFGGTPDLAMYSFDATVPGKLDLVTSQAVGAAPTGASFVALTP